MNENEVAVAERGLSRRAVVQGAAWALPVIAVAVAGREVTERPNQNIWVGPFTFTALNPECVL